MEIRSVDWVGGKVKLIDQTRIPSELVFLELSDYRDVIEAICTMRVRGAPAIGVTAALGIALAAQQLEEEDAERFLDAIDCVAEEFRQTRPTAVNLFWAVERMANVAREGSTIPVRSIKERLLEEALTILQEDIETNRKIGQNGAELLEDGDCVLTHCNAGALATAGYGTALGIVRAAIDAGKQITVIADETRPRLQGMKLTTWELLQSGIPVTCITDNMAGWVMANGMVDKVIVGADRIAANGDVANKVGTYGVAVLAHEHGIPFYVAAPLSTVDLSVSNGRLIPIEERCPMEVTHIENVRICPQGVSVLNPAFDITPSRYVTAIVTERAILYPPYEQVLKEVLWKNC